MKIGREVNIPGNDPLNNPRFDIYEQNEGPDVDYFLFEQIFSELWNPEM